MRHRRKRRRFSGFAFKVGIVLILLAALWIAGFFVFLEKIPRDRATTAISPKIDAIVVLTGGGGLLTNFDVVLRHATGLPVSIVEDPLTCGARGAGRVLEEIDTLGSILQE